MSSAWDHWKVRKPEKRWRKLICKHCRDERRLDVVDERTKSEERVSRGRQYDTFQFFFPNWYRWTHVQPHWQFEKVNAAQGQSFGEWFQFWPAPHALSLHSSIPISYFRFLLLLRNDQNSSIQETCQPQKPHFFNRSPQWTSSEEEEEENKVLPQIQARDRPTNPNRSIIILFLFRWIHHPPKRVLPRWCFGPRPTLAWKAHQERRCRSSDYRGTRCSFFLVFVTSGRIDFSFDFGCNELFVNGVMFVCSFVCMSSQWEKCPQSGCLFVCLNTKSLTSMFLQFRSGSWVFLWWYCDDILDLWKR